jgi:transposase-like protein
MNLGSAFPNETVDHANGQYVIGVAHTDTIEGFWSLVKRGMVGAFRKISKRRLPLYVAEFEFRYNHRHNPDIFGATAGRQRADARGALN